MPTTTKGASATAGPSVTDIAWAAGLFEGEGCVDIRQRQRQRPASYTRLRLNMTDLDVLERFARVMGAGTVRANTTPVQLAREAAGHAKPSWNWAVHKLDDVTRITGLLYPHLGSRRQAKIVECFAADTRLA